MTVHEEGTSFWYGAIVPPSLCLKYLGEFEGQRPSCRLSECGPAGPHRSASCVYRKPNFFIRSPMTFS
jgi:hypothetical protein